MKNSIIIFALLALTIHLFAQEDVPTPAAPQSQKIILLGGTAHIGNGQVIQNSAIVFDNGKIISIGDASTAPDQTGAKVIHVDGKQVYPGLIAANTILGLDEIDAARATNDYYEVGDYNPDVRSIIAYNTDSRVTPTIRSNGVLLAEVVPQGGIIAGESSVVELDGWNYEDAGYKLDVAIHLSWPGFYSYSDETQQQEANKDYTKQVAGIADYFNQAKAYSEVKDHPVENLKFEAMRGLFDGTKKLFVNTDDVREMEAAIDFSKKLGVKTVIVGGADSWMIADLLKENNIAVILGRTHAVPNSDDADIDQPYKTPYELQQKGVLFSISVGGAWQQRNISFEAGTAAAYGLTKEQALASITSNTAKILGIDNTVGTLENGKDATLFVSEGDILDMRTAKVDFAFIRGKQIDLDNKQKELYRKFMTKYGLKPNE